MPSPSNSPIIAHSIYGNGPEKVIALHSWMGDSTSFDEAKKYWNTDAFTYAFVDLRGYGNSRKIAGDYSAAEASSDVFALADALGWRSFHVIGHSMSGMIAQRIALDDKAPGLGRVRSVVAVCPVTADCYPADEATRDFLKAAIHNQELSEQLVGGLTGQRLLSSWAKQTVSAHIATSTPEAMHGYYRMWVLDSFGDEAAAAGLNTPMLIISGKNDLPGFQQEHYLKTIASWYSDVELLEITDSGHFPMHETPGYFATVVENFLTRQNRAA